MYCRENNRYPVFMLAVDNLMKRSRSLAVIQYIHVYFHEANAWKWQRLALSHFGIFHFRFASCMTSRDLPIISYHAVTVRILHRPSVSKEHVYIMV